MQLSKAVQFIGFFWLFLGFFLGGSFAKAQLRSDFRMFSDSFVSPAFETSQKTNYQFAGVSLRNAGQGEDSLQMDIEGAVAFGAPLLNYLNISEFFYQNKQSEQETLIIGRKLMHWSDLDERWNLGIWQPVFQWNPLSPTQQGLSGIFWQTQRENLGVTVFGSPFYLPNQGPSFEVTNGAFVDGNPWFRRPPESVILFGETTAIDYSMQKPSESQVVLKTSYGAKADFGSSEGLLLEVAHMYKPSNQLALGYSKHNDIPRGRAVVDLKPQVFFHSVTSADLSYRYDSLRYGLSALLDQPQKDVDLDPSWTRSRFADAILYSPFVEWVQPSYMLTLQGLQVQGGEVTEIGDSANPQNPPLSLRYPFQQAVKASVENRLTIFTKQRLVSKLSYTISSKNDFEYLQWQLKCRLNALWTLFSELELVRAADATLENQNEIAQYRNLDRFLIGAAYVF